MKKTVTKKFFAMILVLICGGAGAVRAATLARVIIPGENGTMITNNYDAGTKALKALNNGPDGVEQKIIFLSNIAPSETITIASNKVAVLEFEKGCTQVTLTKSYRLRNNGTFTINLPSTVKILHSASSGSCGLIQNNGTLVINGSGRFETGGTQALIANTAAAASLTINGCTFYAYGNNPVISNESKLVVNGGTFDCRANTAPAFDLIGGEAIFNTTKENGIQVKAAGGSCTFKVGNCNLTINNGTFDSNSTYIFDGCATTQSDIVIKGGKFSAYRSHAFFADGSLNKMAISGGKFSWSATSSSDVFATGATEGNVSISGGSFVGRAPEAGLLATGYGAVKTEEAGEGLVYVVVENEKYVAQVGDEQYETLAAAIEAAKKSNDKTVTILAANATFPSDLGTDEGVEIKINDGVVRPMAPEGYKWDESGNLVERVYVAQVGDTKYESLEEAIEAAKNGDDKNVTILADGVTLPEDFDAAGDITLKLGEGVENPTPPDGYKWNDEGELVAKVLVALTAEVNIANAGLVTGAGNYYEGETATLTATANEGYTFVSWSGDVSSTDSTVTVETDSAKNIKANFVSDDVYAIIADEALVAALESGELVSRDAIKDMSLQHPMIEVNGDGVTVGIKLMTATTLQPAADGDTSIWTEVSDTEDVYFDATDKTVKVRVPAEGNTRFFRFVPKNGFEE